MLFFCFIYDCEIFRSIASKLGFLASLTWTEMFTDLDKGSRPVDQASVDQVSVSPRENTREVDQVSVSQCLQNDVWFSQV